MSEYHLLSHRSHEPLTERPDLVGEAPLVLVEGLDLVGHEGQAAVALTEARLEVVVLSDHV